MKHIIARVHGAGQTAVLGVAVALSLAGYWLDKIVSHAMGQARRVREAPAESGIAIVEMILILVVLIGIVFVVMNVLGGAAKTAGNKTANCITNPTAAGC